MTAFEADRVRDNFYHLLEKPQTFRLVDTEHVHKDGHVVMVDTSGKPVFDTNHQFCGYRGVDRDITARLTMETKELFLLRALDQMAEAALFVDIEGTINYVNEAFYKLFGYTQLEIIGKPLHILTPDDIKTTTTWETLEILTEKGVVRCEVMRKKANGRVLPIYLTASSVLDADNKVIGYAGSYMDMTPFNMASAQIEDAYTSVISAISLTVEQRDPYTSGHQKNVSLMAAAIARRMKLDANTIRGLKLGAAIHDIGKIHVPAEILSRPGKLSDEEMNLIKTHSIVGYNIVRDIDFPWPIADMILQHHERLDGSGYPAGLSGDQICLEARIIAVADVIDAITSHRPYRPSRGLQTALDEIREHRGTLYDPKVVDACLALCNEDDFSLYH